MSSPSDPMSMHEQFRATRFFGSLDGLRCLSILAVIWHHTAGHSFDYAIARRGDHGVTLFFAISGFLITTLLLRERDKLGDISLKKFYMRRSLRIFPLYYTVLLLYIALVLVMERGSEAGRAFWGNLPAYATYTTNWFVDLKGERVIFYFAWSLATEEQFYLVWPWVQKYLRRWGAVLFMAVMLVIAFLAQHNMLPLQGLPLTILASIMPGICLGAILAHLLHEKRTFNILALVLGQRFSSVVFLALFLGYLAYPGAHEWGIHALGVLVVGSCVIREDHLLRPIARFKPIAWAGMISYGMYMMHMLAKNGYDMLAGKLELDQRFAAMGVHPAITQFVGATLIVFVIATLSFKYYESIFLRLKHKYDTVSKDPR